MRNRTTLARAGLRRLRTAALIALVLASALVFSARTAVRAQQIELTEIPVMPADRAEAFAEAASAGLSYLPGEVLVKFRDGTTAVAQQRALDAIRSRPSVADLRPIGDVYRLSGQPEQDATILSAQLASQPEVEYAEPNYIYHRHVTPTDPSWSRQWNFTVIDLPAAWDIQPGGKPSIIAAVVDTGITTVNQSFSAQTWNGRAIQTITVPFRTNPDMTAARLVNPRDVITGGGATVLDLVGHGTHVSSTIGEDTNNTLAEAGIAYNVNIMPVKVCVGYWEIQFSLSAAGRTGFAPAGSGGCDIASIATGIRYAADNAAQVINLSLGGPGSSTTLRDAITYAVGRGAFVAMAMGNEFEDGNPTEYPAADAPSIDGAMAVGAIGRSLTRAYYSNTGNHIEIVAPGGNDRDGGASGMIWQATLFPPDSDETAVLVPRFDRYAEVAYEGTSMAAPHVVGIAALIMSQGVTNPAAVEAVIKRTAKPLGASSSSRPGWNADFGYGLIQPRPALRGFGIAR